SDKVVRDFKFSAKGEQECGVVNHGSSDFCNYEAQVSETWVPDVQFIEASCYLDPEYIQKTYDKRLFKPTEITPFDDIICEAKLRVNPHLPQFTTKPKLKGELLTLDEKGNWSVLITETKDFMNYIGTNYSVKIGPFNPLLTEQMTPTYDFDVYQWKIKGWYKEAFKEGFNIMGIEGFGWAPNQETLNKLVTNSRVYSNNIRFFVSVFEEKSNNLSRDFSTYNCVHIWGKEDADFSFGIIALSSAKFSPRGIVWMAIEIKKQAIDFISPFREYPQTFSYYADLATVAEEDFVFDTEFLKKLEYFISAPDLKKVTEMSSCSSDYYILISGGEKHYSGYVRYVQQNVVNLNVDRSHSFYATLLHEFGHSFVKLEDEYSFEEIGKISRLPNLGLIRFFVNQFGISGKNCRLEPNWGNYGNYLIPCGIYSFNKRPSLNSLMNSPNKVPFLNVVSCGYILQKMGKCSNINSCWEMCANPDWNTLKSEQQFCGEYLFNPLTQKCCSNRANNQDYLFPDKGCCGEPGNQIGFDSSTEECCIKEGIGSTGEACCGEEGKQISYSPSSQKCCPDGSVIDLKGDCTDKNQNILLVPIIDV
ncbi:hypothetical protein FJZ17_04545, partial [Candidatus Pacearchaeota archaeon]|nr:hypothetical protein [Candidatus Pacearchaeota archaeon]